MSDHPNGANGNGAYSSNGNGHAKPKAFDIVPPKSPEQIAREEILSTMPRLRRECSRDRRLKRHVGAKWLFAQISDLTFLHTHGGDGFGRIYISVRDLKRIFGHDEGTLGRWRDKLIECGWIWFRDMWPKSCWGITGVCRQPELFPPNSEYIQQAVKGEREAASCGVEGGGLPQVTGTRSFLGKMAGNGQTVGDSPGANGQLTSVRAATHQQCMGNSPAYVPQVTATSALESPANVPQLTSERAAGCPPSAGNSPAVNPASCGHIKETPREYRSLGAIKGGSPGTASPPPPPKLPKFDRLDPKAFDREREKIGNRMIETCKEKIYAVENTRTPVKGRADIVAAYRARIKEIKAWQNREVTA